MAEKILIVIWCSLFFIISFFLLYRAIRPKMKKNEIKGRDLNDIKQQWWGYGHEGEPSIEFVYEISCEYEKSRMNIKIILVILGLINLLISICLLYEIF